MKKRDASLFFLFLPAFALSFRQITDLDVWTNLAGGRWMWEHGAILRSDIFSYPYFGAPWINHQWLWQILTFLAYRAGGADALIVARCLVVMGALAVLWQICRHEVDGSSLITCAVLGIGIFAMSERILERAHLLSLLFTAVTMGIMERWTRTGDLRNLGILAVLQVLWANLHGGFILGPLICLTGWTAVACARASWKALILGASATGVLLCLSLINPFGWRLFTFVSHQWADPAVRQTIAEWVAPFAPGHSAITWQTWFYGCYLSLILCSCAAVGARWDAKRFLWAALGVCMFFSARRHADLLVFLSAPFIVDNMTQTFRAPEASRMGYAGKILFAVTALASTVWVASNRFWISQRDITRFGLGVSELAYPNEAAGFIARSGAKPNLFHNYNCGSYLVYHLSDKYPVFIDGRNLVYSDQFLRRYFSLFSNPGLFNQIVRRHGINAALLLHGPESEALQRRLLSDRQWKLVYLDSKAAVFAKNIPEHAKIPDIRPLQAGMYTPDERKAGYPWQKLSLASFFFSAGDAAGAGLLLQKALEEYPRNPEAHFLLGTVLAQSGDQHAASAHWEEAIRRQPAMLQAQYQIGLLHDACGHERQARIAYQNALFLAPNQSSVLEHLAMLEHRTGHDARAKALMQRLLSHPM